MLIPHSRRAVYRVRARAPARFGGYAESRAQAGAAPRAAAPEREGDQDVDLALRIARPLLAAVFGVAALTMLREMMADHGPASIEARGLIKNDLDAGSVELLDDGKGLADRATQAVPS